MAVSGHAPPYINDAPFAGGAGFSSYRNGTTLIFVRVENWRSSQPATDAQFHDSIEVNLELDCPFKASRPKRLNEFGTPVKRQYRSEEVATALGISTDLLRWRFEKGNTRRYVRTWLAGESFHSPILNVEGANICVRRRVSETWFKASRLTSSGIPAVTPTAATLSASHRKGSLPETVPTVPSVPSRSHARSFIILRQVMRGMWHGKLFKEES